MNTALLVSNILLWIAVCTMAVVIYALVRQIGVLYERVAPAGALALNRKLRAGQEAPRVSATLLEGGTLEIGAARADGRSRLLFFVAPDCPVCKTLLPAVRSAAQAERDWLDVVFAGDGDVEEHRALVRRAGLEGFAFVLSEVLGHSYGVGKLPYAVLIDAAGRIAALGIVNSREHLDSLFEAKEHGVGSVQEFVAARMREESGEAGA